MPIMAVIRPAWISLYPEYKDGFLLYNSTDWLEMTRATIPSTRPGIAMQKQENIEKIPKASVAPLLGSLLFPSSLFP